MAAQFPLSHTAQSILHYSQRQFNQNPDNPLSINNIISSTLPVMLTKSQLLEDIDEASEQVCSIHQDTVVAPFRTACDHVFCADCIRRLLEYDHRCPECRENLYDYDDEEEDDRNKSDDGDDDEGGWGDEEDYSSEGEWDDEDDYSSEEAGDDGDDEGSEWEEYDERKWNEADEEEVDPHREAREEYRWEMAMHRAEEAEQYDEQMEWQGDWDSEEEGVSLEGEESHDGREDEDAAVHGDEEGEVEDFDDYDGDDEMEWEPSEYGGDDEELDDGVEQIAAGIERMRMYRQTP